jgi:hypothetical protein
MDRKESLWAGEDRYWYLWLLFGWAVFSAALVYDRWNAIHWLTLFDTDDNLRFAQVRDWLRGQAAVSARWL